MKTRRYLVVLVFLGLLLWAGLFVRGGLQIVAGYSAKQMCSGVFVAGLPQSFVWDVDVMPRMRAAIGPAHSWLDIRVDRPNGFAVASILGVSAQAVHRIPEGCILFGDLPGLPPRPAIEAPQTVAVPGVLEPAFDDAFEEAEEGGRNTLALLVSVDGQLVAERYAEPVTASTPMQGWSMNKSLMATWVGMQTARGALDPTLRAVALDPTLPRATPVDKEGVDERLTLLHLLQMESGIDFGEVYGVNGDATRMFFRTRAMWTVPAGLDQAYPPGQHFSYSSGDTVLASYLWQRSLPGSFTDWLEENFRAPLGLTALVAEPDASGVQVGSSFAYLTPRDWLRVGQLWLDAWQGRSQLLPQEWLRASVKPRPSDRRGRYGRGFWLNTGGVAFPALPESLFFASGNAGQYVLIVPEWELVVVRLGLTEAGSRSGVGAFLKSLAALERDGILGRLRGPVRLTPEQLPAEEQAVAEAEEGAEAGGAP